MRQMRKDGDVKLVGSPHSKLWICTGKNVKVKQPVQEKETKTKGKKGK